MVETTSVELTEVGPREGFQFEGIGDPAKIPTEQKVRLVHALAGTGLKNIQVTSFVSPRAVPQMADAEAVTAALETNPKIRYTAIFLNDKGLERALAAEKYSLEGRVSLTASETFSLRNQRRNFNEDVEMQRRMLRLYREHEIPVTRAGILAAFGCNWEGDIPLQRILELLELMHELVAEVGGHLEMVSLADTMGRADPEQVKRTVAAVRNAWPRLEVALHLHDTRGTGMANVYAGLEVGVKRFDTSVGGLGGCPFAGVVAGNVPTEDVVFMCERMGIDTGVDLDSIARCARLAEEIVGHSLPTKMGHVLSGA